MSELFKRLKTRILENERIELQPIKPFDINTDITKPDYLQHSRQCQFDIFVEYRMQFFARPDDAQEMKKVCIEELREAIYGEYRLELLELQKALYQRDWKLIEQSVGKLVTLIRG